MKAYSYLNQHVEKTLKWLTRMNFSKAVDSCKEYAPQSMLYFMQLSNKKFIVVSHSNYKRGKNISQGFDLWIAEYDRASDIGNKKATSMSNVKSAIHLPEDSKLINDLSTKVGG
ncbi:MAG TPA: hypothetical protein DGG95_00390 [Cytophagales bacterium]|jgi:hypothetical protein|nr:hypothetical protein [Cytophagales bacterium]